METRLPGGGAGGRGTTFTAGAIDSHENGRLHEYKADAFWKCKSRAAARRPR